MGYFEDRDFTNVPTIPEYFKDKTVFITGGTGFIGKLLIEKLLYSCTDLKRIYLLLRSKKGKSPGERLDEMYSIPCFNRLRTEKPDVFKSKVSVVCGDVMDHELGLSKEDRKLLINEVDVIFHVAASVRFDDTLKYAVKLNLCGTIKVIELAKEVKNLSSIVHVSTSYSNSHRETIDEIMYPPLANWRELIEIVDKTDEHTLMVCTSKILGEVPNTYTFSKHLAEHVVNEMQGVLPAVIYRPSVVVSASKEPSPGWIDNLNGPVGLLIACGTGLLRTMHSDPNLKPDYIPVDSVVQGLIAAAWARGTKKLEPVDDVEIYNSCSGKFNPISYGEFVQLGQFLVDEIPTEKAIWYPGGGMTACKYDYYLRLYLFQVLPAILIDLIIRISGNTPMVVKIQRRIFNASQSLKYYVNKQWTFCHDNFISLRSSIKEEDRDKFYYDLEGLDIVEHFRQSCLVGKEYLLKEKLEDLPKARAWLRKLKFLDRLVKLIFYVFCIWWFCNLTIVQSIANDLYDLVSL